MTRPSRDQVLQQITGNEDDFIAWDVALTLLHDAIAGLRREDADWLRNVHALSAGFCLRINLADGRARPPSSHGSVVLRDRAADPN
jgi:hypothetical protein